jgi:hypothetical protein
MAYKPEQVDRRYPYCKGCLNRLNRDAKKAAKRTRRRAERRDPENAPTRFTKGWL